MDNTYIQKIKSMTEAGFNAVESSEPIISGLDNLCQLMFDPENQPPQMTREEAWQAYLDIRN